ncbi:MAG: acetoacetyl-CoA reductase [Spongiibacteraceae bacterium]|nr:acetoacetyl-CoA reductase [Spongiibacteraceae bacterium]
MNRLAVVTGGTRGIGAAISKHLKRANFSVAALYVNNDIAASEFAESTGISIFKFNVGDFRQCQEGIRMIQSDMGGPIDVLVNNAGITKDGVMHKMSLEQWQSVIQNNLSSCFNMTRGVIEGMREREYGRIVNLSSANAQSGQFGQTNYAASKAGILGFTKALALENARYHITVNALASGYVNTNMADSISEEVKEKIISTIPMGRFAEPDEIARCVEFLVDEKSEYITGSTFSINGGVRME